MADKGGCYQICGPNAFNRYGFSDQIPNRVYAYNNRLSGERTIGAITLTLIKVADDRLGDTEETTTPDGLVVTYSSRVRTLVDAVYDWTRFNGLPRGYSWIARELAEGRVKAATIVAATLRYGDLGTIRRIGALLARRGVSAMLLRRLDDALTQSTGTIPWIPSKPKRGTLDRRWGVVMNGEI
jgi:predicted transcriptional regulator of viral defense system